MKYKKLYKCIRSIKYHIIFVYFSLKLLKFVIWASKKKQFNTTFLIQNSIYLLSYIFYTVSNYMLNTMYVLCVNSVIYFNLFDEWNDSTFFKGVCLDS